MFWGNASSPQAQLWELSPGTTVRGCLPGQCPGLLHTRGRDGVNRNSGQRIAVGADGLPRSSVLMAFLQGRGNQGNALPALPAGSAPGA